MNFLKREKREINAKDAKNTDILLCFLLRISR
jgi:hypothetical protein